MVHKAKTEAGIVVAFFIEKLSSGEGTEVFLAAHARIVDL